MRATWITFADARRGPDGQLTSDMASLRYRVLSPIRHMDAGAAEHRIIPIDKEVFEARGAAALETDLLIFSKSFLPANETLAEDARARGIRVLLDLCDDHFDHPEHGAHYRTMTSLADQVVCNTPQMAQAAACHGGRDPVVIPDPYEGPRGEPAFAPGETLKLLWFGHPLNLDSLEDALGELIAFSARRPVALTVLTQPTPAFEGLASQIAGSYGARLAIDVQPWSLEGQWAALAACDAVILPTHAAQAKQVKSPNRLVETLWAGKPAAVQPLPAYAEFEAWTPVRPRLGEALQALLDDPAAVPAKIAAAQAYIAEHHDPTRIARLWQGVMQATPKPAPIPADGKVRLNLGCGDKILDGYVNVDVVEARAGKTPDVMCDLRALTPFADNSADEVMAIHVVEHFWRWEVVDVLKEWVRVLKPGGKMILECPNLISACEALLADPDKASRPGADGQRSMWVFYGDPRWTDPLMVHRWGYTPKSLAIVMHEAGLHDLAQEKAQFKLREPRDMRITGFKPKA